MKLVRKEFGINIFRQLKKYQNSTCPRSMTSRFFLILDGANTNTFLPVTFRTRVSSIFHACHRSGHAILLDLRPSIDVMRMSEQQRNTGAARFLVIKGWDKEGGRELESNRAGKQQRYDTIRNPWRVPWMLSRSFPRLKLKQTPLSEPIRDTPPFPYSPAAGATCRLFKLLQWLRSTVETF